MYLFNACPRDCYDTCSIVTRVRGEKVHSIEPNSKHPFTKKMLCPKMKDLVSGYVYSKERVLHPLRRIGPKGSGEFERIPWAEALRTISNEIKARSSEFGTSSVVQYGYAGSMGLIQRRFPSRFFNAVGAGGIDETICSSAGAKALEIMYGSSLGMLPDEIEKCRLIVVWGMNPAWSSPHGLQMLRKAKKAGAKIYVIDPIKTETAELGTHLQVRPTTDAVLALGCVNHLIENRLHNEEYIKLNTTGFDKLAEIAKKFDMHSISRTTGLKIREIEDFIADYASMRPSCIMIGYGMQRNRNGGDMVRAIATLPAMIGEGRSFFYSTDIDWYDSDYLEATHLTSRQKTHYGMTDFGRTLDSGKVKMVFVYNSNPLATLPNQQLVRKGFMRDDVFVVVHDLFMTDTADCADIVLPATTCFEHFDINDSYFHQYISLNEKAVEPLGECRSNSDLFRALASEMGLTTRELFEEDEKIAQTLISKSKMVEGKYETLKKRGYLKIKVPERKVFQTPTRKIELYSAAAEAEGLGGLPSHVEVKGKLPYQLITPVHMMLCRSQYHQKNPQLEPVVYVSPKDMKVERLDEGSTVTLRNEFGDIPAKVEMSDAVPEGVLLSYSALWPKLTGGASVNVLTTDFVQRYGQCSAFNSTFVEIL
ncbi:TPA: molybdopterin-dependent oxidoreductase [Thermoplasmata archaeon]|nr:molybdopterin-dependent oxidoreductase [Thermoplasmata archaeon]